MPGNRRLQRLYPIRCLRKNPEAAGLQDLLIYVTKGLSAVSTALRAQGTEIPAEINHLVTANLFATITNVNFDPSAIRARIRETLELDESVRLIPFSAEKGDGKQELLDLILEHAEGSL